MSPNGIPGRSIYKEPSPKVKSDDQSAGKTGGKTYTGHSVQLKKKSPSKAIKRHLAAGWVAVSAAMSSGQTPKSDSSSVAQAKSLKVRNTRTAPKPRPRALEKAVNAAPQGGFIEIKIENGVGTSNPKQIDEKSIYASVGDGSSSSPVALTPYTRRLVELATRSADIEKNVRSGPLYQSIRRMYSENYRNYKESTQTGANVKPETDFPFSRGPFSDRYGVSVFSRVGDVIAAKLAFIFQPSVATGPSRYLVDLLNVQSRHRGEVAIRLQNGRALSKKYCAELRAAAVKKVSKLRDGQKKMLELALRDNLFFYRKDHKKRIGEIVKFNLSVNVDKRAEVAEFLTQKLLKGKSSEFTGSVDFKVFPPKNSGHDPIIIYSNNTNDQKKIERILIDYQREHKAYFGGASPLYRKIAEGITVSGHPKKSTVDEVKSFASLTCEKLGAITHDEVGDVQKYLALGGTSTGGLISVAACLAIRIADSRQKNATGSNVNLEEVFQEVFSATGVDRLLQH